MTTFIHADEIRAATFVRSVEVHKVLGSTNDRAAELARDSNIELPALVVARHQTAGRGRGTNTWQSADGALTFSLLIDPASFGVSAAQWPQLSLATAVAVCDGLAAEIAAAASNAGGRPSATDGARAPARSAARLAIKWPNDVMLDGAKVAGILIESPGGAAPAKDRLIIGIGINVNNSCREMPREAGPNRIGLCDVSQHDHDLHDVLVAVINAIELRLKQVGSDDPQLAQSWQEKCWLTEQAVEVHYGNTWVDGICLGIDSAGALLVENVFGIHRLVSGSVRVK